MRKYNVGDIVTDGIFSMKITDIYKDTETNRYYYECIPVIYAQKDYSDMTRLLPESLLEKVSDENRSKLK